MTENYEKGDILQMIEHIDSMKNSNNDRVQEIYEEVDSYTIDNFNFALKLLDDDQYNKSKILDLRIPNKVITYDK